MASRLFDPANQYRDDEGVICAGGKLVFYITNTTTAKNVFSERALSNSLGNSIDLDASGRAEDDFWLASDDLYRVQLYQYVSPGVYSQVWSRDDVGDANVGGLVPLDPADGNDGDVYRTDGVDPYWGPVSEVPDMAGHSNEYLTTDGEQAFWTPLASYDADNLPGGVVDGTTYLQIGNTMLQMGSGTASTNGTNNVTASVTFSPAFDSAPKIVLTPTIASINNSGWTVSPAAISGTASGFTANFWADGEHGSTSTTIDSAVTFNWFAMGPRVP